MINLVSKKFTVTQLMIAAGLSRKCNRSTICAIVDIRDSYISKLIKDKAFIGAVETFRLMPPDPDLKEYHGESTLLKMVGKYIYNEGERFEMENS